MVRVFLWRTLFTSALGLGAAALAMATAPASAWAQPAAEDEDESYGDADADGATAADDDGADSSPEPTAADSASAKADDDWGDDQEPQSQDDGEDGWGDDDDGPKLSIEWGGHIQSDLRFRVEDKAVGGWYARRELPVGVDRNENQLGLDLTATYGNVRGVADIDFSLYGFSQDIETVGDLSRREKIDPYRFDVHKLYVQISNLGLDGLDLTVGQQLLLWGVGDQFNPTNNLNSDDVEDVLLFGDQQGNFMVKLDYWIDESWTLTGVLVPIFKPALLPRSGELAVSSVERLPLADEDLRYRIHAEQATSAIIAGYPTIVRSVTPVLPETTLENMQFAYRISGTLGGQDVSASYYNGRTDFPVPVRNHTTQTQNVRCNPDDGSDCINGLLETNVFVHYPRMHVYGFNMAGEVGWLEAISDVFNSVGYRMEVALIVPEQTTLALTNGDLALSVATIPAGEYDYEGDGQPGGRQPVVIEDQPFLKWTLGLDYTFTEWLYANVQWVHGMPDEYGAGDWIFPGETVRDGGVASDDPGTIFCALQQDGTTCATEVTRNRIGDYLVLGIDVRLLDQKLLLRLFNILDLTGVDVNTYDPIGEPGLGETFPRRSEHHGPFSDEGFGMVIYPEVNYNFGNGLDLGAGTLLQLGKPTGKFGDPAAGGSLAWARTRFAF